MTYLDYQATTPLAPEALAAMLPWLESQHANPHSSHREGRRAKAAVEVARDQVAALLPPGGRVAFTSGATEALNWAIKGTPPGDIVTIGTEHAAVLDSVAALESQTRAVMRLPVNGKGIVSRDDALVAAVPGVSLIAAMLVNNEIGVIQPIEYLSMLADFAGAPLLCDAVQGFGRIPIPETVDLVAISAHKIHGPKGIGALWIRDGVDLAPLMHGGGQEAPGRSGTLSPALCAGFGVAARLMADRKEQDAAHIDRLWALALDRLGPGWTINGATDNRYHGNLNIRREGLDVNRLMSDLRDIAFSAGSACASGSGRSSHVLRTETQARASIRLGFGRYTTEAELRDAVDAIVAAAEGQWP
jgi:cysteine desulfurase